MAAISSERIPNNVNLSDDRRLQRALESWQPDFIDWWKDMGPEGFQEDQIYLRTAVSVDAGGWAHFDYVKMPEYRWGIFLTPPKEREIHFGDNMGKPIWDEVPGEVRKELRRIIVTQADTEPASVEQQRLLGRTAPSLYDLRNLFQVNVEEGRHLWAMVYLLHSYFGRDGREEADELLERRAGNEDSPRILGTFNEPIETWMDFFCFTMFTDRDGKYQLAALAESSFDPLARSTQFMLTEEAHHLFVGQTGIARIIERTCELMKEMPNEDVTGRAIPLNVIQKYINHWYSLSLDLFGSEDSSNAATFFALGLKGRFRESEKDRYEDPVAKEGIYTYEVPGKNEASLESIEIPMRRAMNLVLRDAYIEDCHKALKKWNQVLKKHDVDFEFTLPSDRFHRGMGVFTGRGFTPAGDPLTQEEWNKRKDEWLPTEEDKKYVKNLMKPHLKAGDYADWIAPPKTGINSQGVDFDYVKFDQASIAHELM